MIKKANVVNNLLLLSFTAAFGLSGCLYIPKFTKVIAPETPAPKPAQINTQATHLATKTTLVQPMELDAEPAAILPPAAPLTPPANEIATQELEINTEEVDLVEYDLWELMAQEFTWYSDTLHPRVDDQVRWLRKNPRYLRRVSQRANRYLHFVYQEINARGLPLELALLPIVESAYKPFVESQYKAAGLWQFIPSTGLSYGLAQNHWYDGRYDVLASTRAALDYLSELQQTFDGDWLLALAAYNAGPGAVRKAIRRNVHRNRPTDFWHLPLPRETRAYVPKLLAIARVVQAPHEYDIELHSIPNTPYFETVEYDAPITLKQISELANISETELKWLNPGYKRKSTGPVNHQGNIVLPVGHAAHFESQLAQLPKHLLHQHIISAGETLGIISQMYDTDVAFLKELNNLSSDLIYAGNVLMVPLHSGVGRNSVAATNYELDQQTFAN